MRTISFLLLLTTLLPLTAHSQKWNDVQFYSREKLLFNHDATQIDSITYTTRNGVSYQLLWQGGKSTDTPIYDIDCIKIEEKEKVEPTGKRIVFAKGVSIESGWYDVNKVGKGENGDINMCWAAAASNIIQWWQDRYMEAGNALPPQAVTGPGQTYELALMEVFHQQWNNDKGGQVAEAVPWYFEGINYGETASPGSQAHPLPGYSGGYFKEVWTDIYPHLYHEYTYMLGMYKDLYVGEFNNYYIWGNGTSFRGKERLKIFTDLVVDFIDRGIAALTISLSPQLRTLLHSTTLWGYEIDDSTGLLTRIWITDSDDLEKEPKPQLLNEYQVSIDEGASHIKFTSSDTRYGACYAVALCPVSGYDMNNAKKQSRQ